MTEVGLNLLDAAEVSGVSPRQHRGDRGLPASLMSHSQHQACAVTEGDGLFRSRLGQRQRLLAEHMLSRSHRRLDLGAVQRMRRREHHRFDGRIVERVAVVGRQRHALRRADRPHRLEVWLNRADDANIRRSCLKNVEYLLAPPTHPDESNTDGPFHICLSPGEDRNARGSFAAVRSATTFSC